LIHPTGDPVRDKERWALSDDAELDVAELLRVKHLGGTLCQSLPRTFQVTLVEDRGNSEQDQDKGQRRGQDSSKS
jgi:hypothetical protein